jgi:hypothetical protein
MMEEIGIEVVALDRETPQRQEDAATHVFVALNSRLSVIRCAISPTRVAEVIASLQKWTWT